MAANGDEWGNALFWEKGSADRGTGEIKNKDKKSCIGEIRYGIFY